jgi:hypothetical protein
MIIENIKKCVHYLRTGLDNLGYNPGRDSGPSALDPIQPPIKGVWETISIEIK